MSQNHLRPGPGWNHDRGRGAHDARPDTLGVAWVIPHHLNDGLVLSPLPQGLPL